MISHRNKGNKRRTEPDCFVNTLLSSMFPKGWFGLAFSHNSSLGTRSRSTPYDAR